MVIMNRVAPPIANQVLPAEMVQGTIAIFVGARTIELWLANSSKDFIYFCKSRTDIQLVL